MSLAIAATSVATQQGLISLHTFEKATTSAGVSVKTLTRKSHLRPSTPLARVIDRFSSASPRFRRILATSIHPRKAYPCSLEATSCTWQHKWKCLATNKMDRGKVRPVHIPNLLEISAQKRWNISRLLGISIYRYTYRFHGPRPTDPGKKRRLLEL